MSGRWLHTANDIVHDLSAGAGPGACLALWYAAARARTTLPADAVPVALRAWSSVLLIPVAALVILVVTGLLRLNYTGIGSASSKGRSRAVLVKHLVFVLVFVLTAVAAVASL